MKYPALYIATHETLSDPAQVTVIESKSNLVVTVGRDVFGPNMADWDDETIDDIVEELDDCGHWHTEADGSLYLFHVTYSEIAAITPQPNPDADRGATPPVVRVVRYEPTNGGYHV